MICIGFSTALQVIYRHTKSAHISSLPCTCRASGEPGQSMGKGALLEGNTFCFPCFFFYTFVTFISYLSSKDLKVAQLVPSSQQPYKAADAK